MGALGVAIVGSVLVGLAKIAEQADRTGARLKALTGSDFANKNLTARAKDLGTSPDKLAPFAEQEEGFVQRRRAVLDVRGGVSHPPGPYQPSPEEEAGARVNILNGRGAVPGGPQSSADVAKFTDTLLQAARIDKTPSDEARAGVSALEQSTFKTGKVTPADLDAINKISPSIGKEIAKAFSGSAAQGGLGRSLPESRRGQGVTSSCQRSAKHRSTDCGSEQGIAGHQGESRSRPAGHNRILGSS